MEKAFLVIIIALLFAAGVRAQQTNNKSIRYKPSFSSINQAGMLTGSNADAFTIQTINGFAFNKWFAGVGVGVDYYAKRGVPLFIDVRREIPLKKHTLFIYSDGGIHKPWATKEQIQKGFGGTLKPGAYFDGGIGWKLPLRGSTTLLISAGYSYKQLTEKAESFYMWSFPGSPSYVYYNNKYNRLVLKVGVDL